MNRIQRWLVESTARLVPDFRRFVDRAGGTMALAESALIAMQREKQEAERSRNIHRSEFLEAFSLSGSGPAMFSVVEGKSVGVHEASRNVELKERLWDLELALEDRGWQRQLSIAATEFSRYGIQQLILIARLYSIKNPLIKRGVYVSAFYVFGRGIEISSDDEAANDAITEFLARNAAELGHTGLVEKHRSLQTDGNLLFCFFTDQGTGETSVRTIDPLEIQDKITDPDDSSVAWFYRRQWIPVKFDPSASQGYSQNNMQDEWYPDVKYQPADRIPSIGGRPVNWDKPILHAQVGGMPKWKFGCPDFYAAIDSARQYKAFLDDWATITRALARFSWDIEQPGGQQAIAGASKAFSSTLGNSATSIEQNPPPTVAAAFVRSPGTKINAVKTAGATTEPEQGRRIMLMVATVFGLPETFFGDASTGSLATAQSLDRPTELKFMEAQELWRELIQQIVIFSLTQESRGAKGKFREALKGREVRFVAAREAPAKKNGDTVNVIVKFPAVLEHDIHEMVEAIVDGATLKGFSSADVMDKKTISLAIMGELGIENPEEKFDLMYPDFDPTVGDGDGQDPEPAPASTVPVPKPAFNREVARMASEFATYLKENRRTNGHA